MTYFLPCIWKRTWALLNLISSWCAVEAKPHFFEHSQITTQHFKLRVEYHHQTLLKSINSLVVVSLLCKIQMMFNVIQNFAYRNFNMIKVKADVYLI